MASTYDTDINRHIRLRCANGIAFGDWIWNPDRVATIPGVVVNGFARLEMLMGISF